MAVTSVKEIHSGRDGDDELQRDSSSRRYTRVFRVLTSLNTDGAYVVLGSASLPALGNAYPSDSSAWCRRRRARNESFSKRVWIVTCMYSSDYEAEENPLDDPAEIEWDTERFQVPMIKDVITGVAHVNAAGELFDPPAEKDDSRWTAVVSKNVVGVPSWLRDYRDVVNDAEFTLDGLTIEKGCAKLSGIHIGKQQERNEVTFRVLTMTFHIRDEGAGDDEGKEWWATDLNAGFRARSPVNFNERVDCTDRNDSPVSSPALLDEDGYQIDDPEPEDATYIRSQAYREADFSALPLT